MTQSLLNRYLPESVRERLERSYYAQVNKQARLGNLILDPDLWRNPAKHPAFFSDHGVVHVRDVAHQLLVVLETINGVLISPREPGELECFMNGYGVILAYLHDIGMSDLSPFGRAMHPEFAAQAVFTDALEDVVDFIWEENSGNIARRLIQLSDGGILRRDPKVIFRELLSLSVGHSKSKIPVIVLDNPAAFLSQMQFILRHDLHDQYRKQQIAKGYPVEANSSAAGQLPPFVHKFYSDFERESFDWMVADSVEAQCLVRDVTDVLRALRCADALRQRGTVQKTSGGYEVFVSPQTGNALIALRLGNDKLYLLEIPDGSISVGEANIASSEFTVEGNIRLSFHRGAYDSDEAFQRSVYATALTINDFLYDMVDSFWREKAIPSLKTTKEIRVLLERTDDSPRFAELVHEHLRQFNPEIRDQIQIVPSLNNVSEAERLHYLKSKELDWDFDRRQAFLERMKQAGQKITNLDLVEGFRHVKITHLQGGETLIEAGTPPAFVYVPLGDGLKVIPLGGYQSFSVAAWMPLGYTGIIRGDIRNADVIAEKDVSLLMIPKEAYLQHWYAPYSPEELKALLMSNAP
jgi:hypothetical protein